MKDLNGDPKKRVKIHSDFLHDSKLNFQAKGLLSYLLANKQDDLKTDDLVKRSKDGRDAIRTIIRELISHGYLLPEKLRNSEGQYCEIRYHIYSSGRKLYE